MPLTTFSMHILFIFTIITEEDPVKAFVDLEHYNGLSLIQKVHRSLVSLSKVIRGSILIDESVSKLADKLMGQETPPRLGH